MSVPYGCCMNQIIPLPDSGTRFKGSWIPEKVAMMWRLGLIYSIFVINSWKILSSRRKKYTKLRKGDKPNVTRPLTKQEVYHLYNIGYFGIENPTSLQRTV